MNLFRSRSAAEYRSHCARYAKAHEARRAHEAALIAGARGRHQFSVSGYSYPGRKTVNFDAVRAGDGEVNWRESLICPVTGLNCRLRAAVQLLDTEIGLCRDDRLYLPEQSTPLYRYLRSLQPDAIGSEFLGPTRRGEIDPVTRIRNEDLTALTFDDGSVDVVGCFECLEHVPDDGAAMRELARVTRPGGRLLLTVPFGAGSDTTLQRATLQRDGSIMHHEAPEYHGDPLSSDGCLCFRHYGWDLLGRLVHAGYADAYAVFYWSDAFCYLGAHQVAFVATR